MEKEKILDYDYGLNPMVIARTVIFFVGIINFILARFGLTPFDLDENLTYEFISNLWIIGAGIWCWWKDNPITFKARVSNIVMKVFGNAVKQGDINSDKNFSIEIYQGDHLEALDFETDQEVTEDKKY